MHHSGKKKRISSQFRKSNRLSTKIAKIPRLLTFVSKPCDTSFLATPIINNLLTNGRKQEKKKKKTISRAHIPLGIPKVSEKKEGKKKLHRNKLHSTRGRGGHAPFWAPSNSTGTKVHDDST